MLARLELKLRCNKELVYQMASLFHGALMEILPGDYADYLHLSKLHPYTQHLEFREGSWYWVVCCLNKEAVNTIIHNALWNIDKFMIKNRGMEVEIVQKSYSEITFKELMDNFYEEEGSRYIHIHFMSPTAFKQQGQYLFYPDLRCLFQSLMNKYDSAIKDECMMDNDTLDTLCSNAKIVDYDLKSVNFSLEGVRIPSFIGKITIKMQGTATMTSFANLLFEFGTYSGVGIKTALGMGCIKILPEERRKR